MNSNDHPTKPHADPKAARRSRKQARRNLVALGSAAVLAVYAAGFLRTASAAHRLATGDRKRPEAPDGRSTRAVATAPVLSLPPAPGAAAPAPGPIEAKSGSPVAASAATPAPASVPAPLGAKPAYKDGVFYGWGSCRHGSLQASVSIQEGRIVLATISQCYTRYSKSVIAALPPQVVRRQSPEVDWISGATESSDAFYYALVEALKQAK